MKSPTHAFEVHRLHVRAQLKLSVLKFSHRTQRIAPLPSIANDHHRMIDRGPEGVPSILRFSPCNQPRMRLEAQIRPAEENGVRLQQRLQREWRVSGVLVDKIRKDGEIRSAALPPPDVRVSVRF